MFTSSRRLTALALVFVTAAGLLAAGDKDEAVKKDRKAYQGTWQATRVVADGNELKPEDVQRITVVNEPDGKWQLLADGKEVDRGTHTIDPAKKPRTIDMVVTEGGNKGKTYLGIYELSGDTRKVCYGDSGKDRPTEFESTAGSGRILAEFKRVKKD